MKRVKGGLLCLFILTGQSAAADGYIAGLTPDVRPPQAPVITTVEKNDGWYRNALRGISPPYPWSLSFLEDQGNWYTPFIHPGMRGRYDLRKLHSQSGK